MSAKSSHTSVHMDCPANERNVSSTYLHYPFLALLFHPQASQWTLIISLPSLSGQPLQMSRIFKSSLALPTSTVASSTGFHTLYLPLRTYFRRANGSTGPVKLNPHLTNSNVASLPRPSSDISILISLSGYIPMPRDLRYLAL